MLAVSPKPLVVRVPLARALLSLTFLFVSGHTAFGQLRDRAEKNAVRGMTGDFDGLGMVLWVSREQAEALLPINPDLRLAYPTDRDRYPIVILLGAEHDVGVQFRRGYVHPKYLKQYENAYVIVPYLHHPALSSYGYTFSRIFVSDEKVTEQGAKLNHSPKVHAAIEDNRDRFVVDFNGRRAVDLAYVDEPAGAKTQTASTAGRDDSQTTLDLLRSIFKQPKIEFSPNAHVFAFDFMAGASNISPARMSGAISVPAIRTTASGPTEISVLTPDHPVSAIRFSSHWTKSLQY